MDVIKKPARLDRKGLAEYLGQKVQADTDWLRRHVAFRAHLETCSSVPDAAIDERCVNAAASVYWQPATCKNSAAMTWIESSHRRNLGYMLLSTML